MYSRMLLVGKKWLDELDIYWEHSEVLHVKGF